MGFRWCISLVSTPSVGSKRMAFFWAATLCLVLSVVFFFIPMNPSYIWVMIAIVILTSMGIGIYSPLMWSMYADVADYHTGAFREHHAGLIFFRYDEPEVLVPPFPVLSSPSLPGLGRCQHDNR